MNAGDVQGLEDLVVECLDRMEEEGPAVLDELCTRAPALAAVLRERIATLRRAGLLPEGADGAMPERLGEYRLIERLGGGGMGVVFVAEHVDLPRRVALKVVRPDEAYFGSSRARFRREAEALAELSHPSIVRIHTIGEHEGLPFFVMELVEGATLFDVIENLRGRPHRALRGVDVLATVRNSEREHERAHVKAEFWSGSYTDVCLRIARDVALALEHAHAHGVLHRDVKPSNVMLTPAGRVVLLDFGLAARAEASRLTRSGSQLGSLAWMAPEQVEGDLARIGPRTDVYGLGVVLYELLALQRAFDATSTSALSLKVLESRPARLRSRNANVSADVETVCAKAMDGDSQNRYETAGDLARDLDNLLAHRPIEARPASVWKRLSRWVRRHPARAASVLLATLLVVGGPLAYSWVQRNARQRIEAVNFDLDAANTELARALKVSKAESERAVEAIRFLTDVGVRRLADVPQAENARRELLEGALRFHRELVTAHAGKAELAHDAALSKVRAGELFSNLRRPDEAREVLLEAWNDLNALAGGARPADTDIELATCALFLAGLELDAGRFAEAESWAARAVERARTGVEVPGSTPRSREILAKSLWRSAQVAGGHQAAPVVVDRWRACSTALAELSTELPERSDLAILWAQACMQTCAYLGAQRVDPENAPTLSVDMQEAESALENVLERLDRTLKDYPDDHSLRIGAAEAHAFLGQLMGATGRFADAEVALRRAAKLNASIVRDFPETWSHREREIMIESGLGSILGAIGK